MRILLATSPEKSIFLYLVPMMWALRTAGHEVRVASQPRFADTITQSGLTAVPVGRDRDPWRITADMPEERERGRKGLPAPYDAFDDYERATWEYLEPELANAVQGWHWLTSFPLIAGLTEYARQWEPDLIIWEPLCFAGPIAAKASGAAHARMLFGVDVWGPTREHFLRRREEQPPEARTDPFADWLGSYARKYGGEFSEDMVTGHFTIDQFPLSLSVEAAGLNYLRTQYIPYGGTAVVPDWLQRPAERPRVALTLGLTATEIFNGYNVPLSDILGSLSELDIEVVATVADSERHKLGTLPGNVRIVSYVPWHAIVPTCSAVVHHAGAATLATTARHPVPQLALHYHHDQPTLARKLAEQGAGLEIHTTQVTGDGVRDAVARLLTEPRFTERAAALRDEMFALPSPNEAVAQLEELTTKHRSR
ncbi:activator-dependent family glycosyltransferase [Amycolatopsis suaedae]|uniref:Activator-dependent family glycosyltransferase n=1 Tax=Amycolatopsis suaedae TaxID=2510978 RepID=A0A4Q7J307_9PSEU|nr:activator-dependent family glycosyltransferase [Amycolatopsis suaedae]RZQ61158.1 activator-dependent family glycosyltransferase [Amycolatopsis suaedae]